MGVKIVRTAFRSPWQNGVAERWILSARQDVLDHVIVLGERTSVGCYTITSATITKTAVIWV